MIIYVFGVAFWLLHVSRCDKAYRTGSWDGTGRRVAQVDRPDVGMFGISGDEAGEGMQTLVKFLEGAFEWIEREANILDVYYTLQGFSLMLSIFRLFKMVRFQPELNIVMDTLLRSRTNLFSFGLIFFSTILLLSCCIVFFFGSQYKAFRGTPARPPTRPPVRMYVYMHACMHVCAHAQMHPQRHPYEFSHSHAVAVWRARCR